MLKKIVKSGPEVKEKIKNGVNFVADIVGRTLGPAGQNAIFNRTNVLGEEITNDGVSIAKEIVLWDEIEDLAAKTMIESCKRTNDKAGDGTTTTTVLARAIFNDGYEKINDKYNLVSSNPVNVMDLRDQINKSKNEVLIELKKISKPVKNKEDLAKVASIASENEGIGNLISDTIEKVGWNAALSVEEGVGNEITSEAVEGLEIPYGYVHPDLVTNSNTNEALFDNAQILVTNEIISNAGQLTPIIEQLIKEKKINQLVLIARDYNRSMIPVLVLNKIKGACHILAVKYMVDDEILEDLATYTGGNFIDSTKGRKMEDVKTNDLGEAKRVLARKDKTLIIKGKGNVSERVKMLKESAKKEKLDSFRKKIERRIGSLSGGIGIIKVGANTETEKIYLMKKIEDAISATKAAIEEGIVEGGGLALKSISEKLTEENVLKRALLAPYQQIQDNGGGKVRIGKDVIDPVKVTRLALENAVSIAGLLLTTNIAIADKREEHCCRKHDLELAELEAKKVQRETDEMFGTKQK